jgi:hypothetical protein
MMRTANFKSAAIAALLSMGLLTGCTNGITNQKTSNHMDTLNLTQEWDKKFPQSNKVNHRKVTFKNRYGITLAADLYEPKNIESKVPAIAVSGPFGAVKEQSSGLYAQTMAECGFLTLAFDPSYTGESGGEPRNVASPDINTEDFSAAVDFLIANCYKLPNSCCHCMDSSTYSSATSMRHTSTPVNSTIHSPTTCVILARSKPQVSYLFSRIVEITPVLSTS